MPTQRLLRATVAETDEAPLPGPAPEFFFAPDEIARRGRALGQQYAAAWERFAPVAERTVRIERVTDGAHLVCLYHALPEGTPTRLQATPSASTPPHSVVTLRFPTPG